jgi:hypothetical protein
VVELDTLGEILDCLFKVLLGFGISQVGHSPDVVGIVELLSLVHIVLILLFLFLSDSHFFLLYGRGGILDGLLVLAFFCELASPEIVDVKIIRDHVTIDGLRNFEGRLGGDDAVVVVVLAGLANGPDAE